ncbi:hypothetical protein NA57DRAFT_77845 [Rhizodiscina lignyota]|uniref:Uncharacterized protein n=1 Tax=Rhizodiscina lignyota TaxID=1504668 RepID=A0A9P4IEI1_9PEZI|nr:hypothetical protein NA57DRAFT_77845 [Rhizodiscina lignyota]
MASKHRRTWSEEEMSVASSGVMEPEENGDDFIKIDEAQLNYIPENCENPEFIGRRRRPETTLEKIRNADYEKQIKAAKEQYKKHTQTAKDCLFRSAIAGLKLANQGAAYASRTIGDYTDSFVAHQEITRVTREGDGRPEPLGCNYVGGADDDTELTKSMEERLNPTSRTRRRNAPSPGRATIAMISERASELPRMGLHELSPMQREARAKAVLLSRPRQDGGRKQLEEATEKVETEAAEQVRGKRENSVGDGDVQVEGVSL